MTAYTSTLAHVLEHAEQALEALEGSAGTQILKD